MRMIIFGLCICICTNSMMLREAAAQDGALLNFNAEVVFKHDAPADSAVSGSCLIVVQMNYQCIGKNGELVNVGIGATLPCEESNTMILKIANASIEANCL